MPAPSAGQLWTRVRSARLIQILMVYLGASFVVLQAIDVLTEQLGLPDWVFPGAVVLLLIGLPIIAATALVQGIQATAPESSIGGAGAPSAEATAGDAAPSSTSDVAAVAKHWLTWKKALMGGVLAFALLGVSVSVYMSMRVLGIGPVGSLVAAGVLDPRDRIVLAEFENNTGDSLLAVAATEAFRIDLSQSPLVRLAETDFVTGALRRMERDPHEPLTYELAREVAIREGLSSVIAGEITSAGGGYLLSARVVAAESGEVLVARREQADSASVIEAIDRLSNRLRERMGESLKTIRANPPLEEVTTSSLEALRKYSQAVRIFHLESDYLKSAALLEEAIALDTAFAMAYRKLGVSLANIFANESRRVEALTKAFQHRDRLTDRERYMTAASYYAMVTNDREKAMTAYSSLIDLYPDDYRALNNLANLYGELRDYETAEELYSRAVEAEDSTGSIGFRNLVAALVSQGKFEQATATLDLLLAKQPGNPFNQFNAAALASAQGDYDTAESIVAELREEQSGSLLIRGWTSRSFAVLAQIRGKLAESERYRRDAMSASEQRGQLADYLDGAFDIARMYSSFKDDPATGALVVEEALARHPLESMAPLNRPYTDLARAYAYLGQPQRARASIAEYEAAIDLDLRRRDQFDPRYTLGVVLFAERHYGEAIEEFRFVNEQGPDALWGLYEMGQAYDMAGQPDSAIVVYERYLNTPDLFRSFSDQNRLALAYERLGQLYERLGDADKAIYYYGKFAELWSDADPELQPRVEAARRAFTSLSTDR